MINLNQTQLCGTSDVNALIENVNAYQNLDSNTISLAITNASSYMQKECKRKFVPFRSVDFVLLERNVFSLPHPKALIINSVKDYAGNLINANLILDRSTNCLAYPFAINGLSSVDSDNLLLLSNCNQYRFKIDATYGFSAIYWSEALTTSDNLTYSFALPLAEIETVYINGTPTTSFTSNIANNSITFASSQSGNTITADYLYSLIPSDVIEATAKRASITLLQSFSSSLYDDDTASSADSIQTKSGKITYTSGAWGKLIAQWNDEIDKVIKSYRSIVAPVFQSQFNHNRPYNFYENTGDRY